MQSVKNLLDGLDTVTENFTRTFGSFTSDQLNRKPDPQTWSVAQIIDHIMKVNESYYPVIESVRKGEFKLPFISRTGFMVSFLGNLVLKSMQPDRKRKVKTFPIWEPASKDIAEGILERFQKHQGEIKLLINDSVDLIENGTIISSPANKYIVYKLETAFDIIVTHEQRHYNQAVEVNETLNQQL